MPHILLAKWAIKNAQPFLSYIEIDDTIGGKDLRVVRFIFKNER